MFGAIVLAVVGCGLVGGSEADYRVPAGEKDVINQTYDHMLTELERRRADAASVLDVATPGQALLYRLLFVDDEIANGGLYQVYWNLDGGFIKSAIEDARTIGADNWADLVESGGRTLFPDGVPDDVTAQRDKIGCPDYCADDSLDALEARWRGGELRPPLRRYIATHRADFFKPKP